MKVDSLEELGAAFTAWRAQKRYAREAVPGELLARARRATKVHGVRAVVRVTQFESARLFRVRDEKKKARGEAERSPTPSPGFTRFEVEHPLAHGPRPLAEVETPEGMRLRVFEGTPEVMGLLSVLCRSGGA